MLLRNSMNIKILLHSSKVSLNFTVVKFYDIKMQERLYLMLFFLLSNLRSVTLEGLLTGYRVHPHHHQNSYYSVYLRIEFTILSSVMGNQDALL
jgi:hypothetical protein